jgi:hypothetical protein
MDIPEYLLNPLDDDYLKAPIIQGEEPGKREPALLKRELL